MIEETVVILKPDAVQRGLIGEIIQRFEKIGLKIIAMKMVKIDKKTAFKHYGYNEEWFEKVGEKLKKFYQETGFDPGEEIARLSNKKLGKLVQKWCADYLTEGPVVAMLIQGAHAIEIVRKIVGETYPCYSPPGTIRGDFSCDSPYFSNLEKRSVRNLIHASGSKEEAKFEKQLWFKKGEIIKW